MEHGTEIDGRCKHFMWLMSIMLDHNDDVFRCLRCTMHVHRNAVVSIALWCLAAVAGRVAELLLLIQSRPRNLIYSRVITFAQIVSRGNSVLLVIIAFIQNSAQHRLYVVISDWWMSPCWGRRLSSWGRRKSRVWRWGDLGCSQYQADLHLWCAGMLTRIWLIRN